LGRTDIVNWYESAKATLPAKAALESRVKGILAALD